MIQNPGWKDLQDRRKYLSLTMLFTIINEIRNIPKKKIQILVDTRTRSKDFLPSTQIWTRTPRTFGGVYKTGGVTHSSDQMQI